MMCVLSIGVAFRRFNSGSCLSETVKMAQPRPATATAVIYGAMANAASTGVLHGNTITFDAPVPPRWKGSAFACSSRSQTMTAQRRERTARPRRCRRLVAKSGAEA
jgi:hypothetical protein